MIHGMARNMMPNHTCSDRPLPTCKTSSVVIATIFTQFKAEGRATSFVVAAKGQHLCILALNKVNIVAVTTILVLHVGSVGLNMFDRTSCSSPFDESSETFTAKYILRCVTPPCHHKIRCHGDGALDLQASQRPNKVNELVLP